MSITMDMVRAEVDYRRQEVRRSAVRTIRGHLGGKNKSRADGSRKS